MTESTILESKYDPRSVEPEIYAAWEKSGAFRSVPDGTPHEKTFTIVIPPPNVTGALHLGHALNNTLQDILVRWHRMRGFNTLWQPGTDHAGIATQAVVERRIRETEGKNRHDLGREELVRRIWEWKDEYEKRIIGQLKLMGCSCDWERSRFTLDEGMSRAVRTQFFKMFKDGLIFPGKRLVNWDSQLQTAVSDDEVYHETVKGHFYHFRYPVIDPKPGEPAHVVIATTRPETMLGDVAVAVHPDPEGEFARREADLRAALATASPKEAAECAAKLEALAARRESHLDLLRRLRNMALSGGKLRLPLTDREIPLICDAWADPTKGSGCVKITPAHDHNDYEVGQRHKLRMINVLTPDGKIAAIREPGKEGDNPNSSKYEGLSFSSDGRRKVVEDMERLELIERIEDHEFELGHSDRSKVPIEPFLSDQWFVRTDNVGSTGLAQAAMDAVTEGRIEFFPPRYTKSYLDWLGEKRDWCISRQLWWGHQIPVWSPKFKIINDEKRKEIVEKVPDLGVVYRFFDLEEFAGIEQTGLKLYRWYACIDPDTDSLFQSQLEWNEWTQDPDVLDTWFSSCLWPFSTLGWPDETPHLKQYYPTSVLVTARDIITNWVARMVMSGLYLMGKVPFDRVYITPKVLDGRGETMSKSKGNGVDPVDIILTCGADALRYTIADMTTETQDIRMPVDYICPACGKLTDQTAALKAETQARKSRGEKLDRPLQPADCRSVACIHCKHVFATQWADPAEREKLGLGRETSEKFEVGRNFCNKLWNAARFAFMNLEGTPYAKLSVAVLPPEDRWILASLSRTIRRHQEAMSQYQFSAALRELREFFWDALCDWYIELTKPRLAAEAVGQDRATAQQVLAFCIDQVLRLLHPIMPFITERLWQQLGSVAPRRGVPGVADLRCDGLLIKADFPPIDGYFDLDDDAILGTFARLQEAVRGVRDLRMRCTIAPKERVTVTAVVPPEHLEAFRAHAHIVRHMAGIGELHVVPAARRPANAGSIAIGMLRIYVHDITNDDAERSRVAKTLEAVQKQISGKEGKLNNARFVESADPEVVAAERQRLADLLAERASLQTEMAELSA